MTQWWLIHVHMSIDNVFRIKHNRNTWSVRKVSREFDFRFFMALCWYSYPSLMPTGSPILNVQLIFDSFLTWTCFGSSSICASSVSGTRKSHKGPDLGNTVDATTVMCCFWPKIRASECVSTGALSWCKSQFLFFHKFGRFGWIASRKLDVTCR